MRNRIMCAAAVFAFACAASAVAQVAPAQDATELAGDAEAGAELYGTECRGCHAVSIAPTLRGVIDRPAASLASFPGYSGALKAKQGLVWTAASIDAFIANPQGFAPGTLMTKSISDPQQRADIIAYIASLPPPRN